MQISETLISRLRRIAINITHGCPEYVDDAVSIMVIGIMQKMEQRELEGRPTVWTFAYMKRVAISYLMEEMFRSRRYLFYSTKNKFPVERYDNDPYRYDQRHHEPSPEDDFHTDILIERIFEDLDEDEKALLMLHYWGELTLEEVGVIMGKSRSSMSIKRQLLLDAIRTRMDRFGYT